MAGCCGPGPRVDYYAIGLPPTASEILIAKESLKDAAAASTTTKPNTISSVVAYDPKNSEPAIQMLNYELLLHGFHY